jgi:hypothetical protein
MEILGMYELELTPYPDGTGRIDTYLVNEVGRWLTNSTPLDAAELASLLKALPEDDDDDTHEEYA